ncbi:MAG: UvrD-helicase domain-containing protein, partial [Patescibacteria group bacterium]
MNQADGYDKKFIDQKKQLNPEQRRAVETIEGPVMVLAGPGTGKTQILTLRIAEIIARSQLSGKNILALTFTESAAAEMRRRLYEIIGPAANAVAMY